MTLLCVAPRCHLPRHHTPDCDGRTESGDECRGCLPARTEVGCLCERCFNRQASTLADIDDMHARLVEVAGGWPVVVDDRLAHESITPAAEDVGEPLDRPRDPVAAALPMGAVRRSGAPRVSGTPSHTTPTSLDVLDLLGPSRTDTISAGQSYDPYAYWAGLRRRRTDGAWYEWRDQAGQPSVATVLHLWALDWHDLLGDPAPAPTVAELVRWLLARWERAAARHSVEAIRAFITETGSLRGRLMTVLHERDPDPQSCEAPCPRCYERNLWRRTDGTGDVDCHSCGRIFKAVEYERYARVLAKDARPVHAQARIAVAAEHAEHGGRCPGCGEESDVDRVTLARVAGVTRSDVVKVTYGCGCVRLTTPGRG